MNKDDDQDHNDPLFSTFFTKKDLASPTHTKVLFFNKASIWRNLTVEVSGSIQEVAMRKYQIGGTHTNI
jgi:hypothetical protein